MRRLLIVGGFVAMLALGLFLGWILHAPDPVSPPQTVTEWRTHHTTHHTTDETTKWRKHHHHYHKEKTCECTLPDTGGERP